MYLVLKHLHQAAVAVSLTLFVLRGVWMWRDSPALEARWVKVVPHVVDTLLLASAIGLAWTLQQYPFVHAWLTAKLLALVLYIVLGSLALKPGRPKRLRLLCFLAALAVFGYIVSVARSHDPRGLFALLAGG
jgi:uncharacterized membrane protein SirB2